jgi:hypothetical protein
MRIVLLGVLGALAACGAESAETVFDGEMLPDGYIRYIGAPVTLQPGETAQYVQWVSGPIDRAVDVINIRGSQGPGGHHAILYASPDVESIGSTRPWSGADQITARFLGGVGGEGITGGNGFPEGAVIRVPAGSGFYIQTHYLNATDEIIKTSSTLEIMVADPSPDVTPLSMFVVSTLDIAVPDGGPSEQTLACEMQQDTSLIMYVNHIHETGTAISTTLQPIGGGAERMLKDDPRWNYEWSTSPNFQSTALDKPLVLHKGDKLTTRCSWNNHSGKTLKFPDEMCAFFTFYVGTSDRACVNGKWIDL